MFTEIRCGNCFAIIPAECIDTKSEKAKCNECGHQFSIKRNLKEDLRKKRLINQPEYADTVVIGKHSLDMELPYNFTQRTNRFNASIPFVVALFKFIPILSLIPFIFFGILFFSISVDSARPMWLFVALLIGMFIYVKRNLASIKNDTKYLITIKDNKLSLTNPKLPLPKQFYKEKGVALKEKYFTIRTEEINQLYVKELQQVEKKHHIYELMILTEDGTHLSPFYPFFNLTDALYIEQEIERFLSIEDSKQGTEIHT